VEKAMDDNFVSAFLQFLQPFAKKQLLQSRAFAVIIGDDQKGSDVNTVL